MKLPRTPSKAPPKKRNIAAKALASPLFQLKVHDPKAPAKRSKRVTVLPSEDDDIDV